MIEIRLLTIKDAPDFFHHRLEGLSQFSSAFGASYEDLLSSGPSHFERMLKAEERNNVIYGAFDHNKLIGSVGLVQENSRKARHRATLWGMYVKAGFHGKGIGRELVQTVINHAKTIPGIQVINLSVDPENQSAKLLYEKSGFVRWGTEPKAMLIDGKFTGEDHMIFNL